MDLVPIDEQRQLFISPSIDEWKSIEEHGITAVIDLDGDLDLGIPNIPNHMLYVYFPIFDEGLPDLNKLHALARLGARLVANGEKVLAHCGMGLNRSALVAGLVLTYLGMKGEDALALLRKNGPARCSTKTSPPISRRCHPTPPHRASPRTHQTVMRAHSGTRFTGHPTYHALPISRDFARRRESVIPYRDRAGG